MNKIDEIFTNVDQELTNFVNTLLENVPDPEPGPFKTSKQLKEEFRHTLTDLVKGKELKERMKRAVEVIKKELSAHEMPAVINRIEQEWTSGISSFMETIGKDSAPKEGSLPPSFQELFRISDETVERLYQCGLREYQGGRYQEAADVFYVLTLLDYRRPNLWMALGLAEQKLHKNDPALVAFDMACLTDPENPLAFLHCAECHLSLGEKREAANRLETASGLVQDKSDARSQSIKNRIASVKKTI